MSFRRTTRSDRELARPAMSSSVRSGTASRTNIRQPSSRLSTATRQVRARPDRSGAISPAESVASSMTAGTKRKERDFDTPVPGIEETNINVVVRCRGRSSREVKENSTVMVNTDGVKGKIVELSMGPSALSDKSYSFDRVFSPAADQSMIYDDTVKPILDDMLAGFNCTIFAYGQTGTGKTYTMSGDMTETLGMLSDEAGIIPRVLQNLFNKLEIDDTENCVKCSFIELYNEELRDLLSVEETAKLKIYDDASRRGHLSTIVQGMEEKHIKNAAEGIKVLQDGSLKRQVAATRCNDLSSRSHTVFTITAYVKKTNEHGIEDLVAAGKLNLVDLAGSENIQRSGAENKRAAEAGLINKSLLTLGRVINALVDRSPHIPYRESKLTRLLQDSLGGRTKTCIIATISPAKANLEETISTLDYAFRAKNIRNKPQLNALLNKKTLLKDFTAEIEKLKSELIATRQRNGVYLSNEAYEEMTAQSESRRIVLEEQAAKLETVESNLRNKVQELFSLTTNFMGLKKEHEGTKTQLDEIKGDLDQTRTVLSSTKDSLAEETELRKAHEETEGELAQIGDDLINKLHRAVHDVSGLHAKNKRKSDLQSINRAAWSTSQGQVADVTSVVERRIQEFQEEQSEHIDSVSRRMEAFVREELQKLSSTQAFLDEHLTTFGESKATLLDQKQKSKEDMDEVLEGIDAVRGLVKERVGESVQAISRAAEKISTDVVGEMAGFHDQLHTSYSTLGKDMKSMFDDLVKHVTTQRSEVDNLRRQLQSATSTMALQNSSISARIQEALEEEHRQMAEDTQKLFGLINATADAQRARLADRSALIQKSITESGESIQGAVSQHDRGLEAWDSREGQHLEDVKKSRDQSKVRLKDDWSAANDRSMAIQNMAKTVPAEAVRIVDDWVGDLDSQMVPLDDFVTRAKLENATHHETYAQSVRAVSNTVEQSFSNISGHFKTTFDRVKNLGEEMELDVNDLRDGLEPLDTQLCQPLANLREDIGGTSLQEYQPTGDTPQKVVYQYPTELPRTYQAQESLEPDGDDDEAEEDVKEEEGKGDLVFADVGGEPGPKSSPPRLSNASTTGSQNPASLREVNPNVTANLATGIPGLDPRSSTMSTAADQQMPLLKHSGRSTRGSAAQHPVSGGLGGGRENVPPPTSFARSSSRRKSPRLN